MGNKIQYFLVFVLAMLFISACIPSNTIKNVETVPKIGDKVPNISWTTINGENIELNQFKGSWVLLCYWCSCPVHRQDILTIRDVYDALYDMNLQVIVIGERKFDSPNLEGFAKENNLPFYLVEDNQESIHRIMSKAVERGGRPIYFLIDTQGYLHSIKLGGFYYSKPPNQIPVNEFDAQAEANIFQLDEPQKRMVDELIFLYDAMTIKFDDIVITNITTCGATIRWKTDKSVPCQLSVNSPRSFCTYVTEPSTNHERILDDILPNETCIFTAIASSYDRGKLQLPMPLYYSSSEYSFTTLSNISNVKISKITDTSAEIYWETNNEVTGTTKLSIDTAGTGHTVTNSLEDFNLTQKHIFKVDNLKPEQLYYVNLQSEDIQGRFDTYDLGFLTQPPNYTDGIKISNVTFTDITDRSAKLNWSTDRPTFCIISGAGKDFLEKRLTPPTSPYEPWATKPSTNHSWLFSELKPETEYTVQIEVPFDSETIVPFQSVSDVFNFKTLKGVK